jgi:hypothetical protein
MEKISFYALLSGVTAFHQRILKAAKKTSPPKEKF